MEVRLTKTGIELLGRSPDRVIANVSTDRAYALMSKGYANQDVPFMALYKEANEPKVEKIMVKQPPKKETATSKKAAKREKAVKQ